MVEGRAAMTTQPIVVGTDGTESSQAAVDWAAHEAQVRRLPLRIVHAYGWDWHESRYVISSRYIDVARKLAEKLVSAVVQQVREVTPEITVEAEGLLGNPASRLLEAADQAELVVLGHRGGGGFAELLL